MNDNETASFYIRDLGTLLKELAIEAKQERDSAGTAQDLAYAEGRLMGLHEVVSLMQQQASAFSMDHAEIGLDGIEPDRDLV